ncbi:hypothetical protein KTR10_03080 [Candidatus Kaiserbacteria bacterium]|nr:hypothetical protein [Candidatus Kaiserbacteria bacterium]
MKAKKPKDSSEWRDTYYHKLFGLKAAKEAARTLPLFEKENPKDKRPRKAIEKLRSWAEDDKPLSMREVRKLSLDSHAAAREAKSDAARYAARAAGQAIATWHIPTHALGAFSYAAKALCAQQKYSKPTAPKK